jgi:hypothetical protein
VTRIPVPLRTKCLLSIIFHRHQVYFSSPPTVSGAPVFFETTRDEAAGAAFVSRHHTKRQAIMNLNHPANVVLNLIMTIIHLVFSLFAVVEHWLRHALAQAGIGGQAATVIMILVAIAFFVGAIRLFGGALQILIVIFLILFALQVLFTIAPA